MSYSVIMIFSFSVAVAATIGWIRFKNMDPAFHPFLFLLSVATLNEIINTLMVRLHYSTAVNTNIYTLCEAIIITWQFQRWRLFRHPSGLYGILIFLILFWILEKIWFSPITRFNSHFNSVYGFLVVMMSITMVNRLLRIHAQQLVIRPILLICFCFAVYYTYNTLIEIFWIWGLTASKNFRMNLYHILYYINLVINLFYAFAFLWIPKRREFIALY